MDGRLELEIEAALFQLLVARTVEAVVLRCAMGDVLLVFVEGIEEVGAEDFFAEIALIDGLLENGFIKAL